MDSIAKCPIYLVSFLDENKNLIGYDASYWSNELIIDLNNAIVFEYFNLKEFTIDNWFKKPITVALYKKGCRFIYLNKVKSNIEIRVTNKYVVSNLDIEKNPSLIITFNKFKANLGYLDFITTYPKSPEN